MESFAGVANPFSLHPLAPGEKVVDIGSGAGFDSFIAAGQVGPGGQVVGVDMTAEMLAKSRQTAVVLGLAQVEFREGLAEAIPARHLRLTRHERCGSRLSITACAARSRRACGQRWPDSPH